jgi:hypothetical protein
MLGARILARVLSTIYTMGWKGEITLYNKNKPYKKKEEKFDVEKWIKQHQNIEYPKRGKKNTLEDKKNKRRH